MFTSHYTTEDRDYFWLTIILNIMYSNLLHGKYILIVLSKVTSKHYADFHMLLNCVGKGIQE